MNKEMQKLLKAINDKKNEVKSLVNDGKLDKARAAKEELVELQNRFDLLYDLDEDEQDGIEDIGGTLRLGSYPCVLDKSSKAYQLYGTDHINERHRHRYEVNNDYRKVLTDHGMLLSGLSPDGHIVEMIELPDQPWFIGTQAHPEFKSRPNKAHPLFLGFVGAAIAHSEEA